MTSVPDVPAWAWQLAVFLGAVVSAAVLMRLARPRGEWGRRLRTRFVLGVPWGTLLTVVGLFAVYLFVQGGAARWHRPVELPFRAWSYFYPLGMLAAGFTHQGASHLVGNVTATLVFGTLAEYAWGHFPTERGAQSFRSLREHPFARILAFLGAVVVVGVVGSAFSLGPVIGFSGVVFAFAGVAILRLPLATLVVLGAERVVSLLFDAVRNPTTVSMTEPRFGGPWWADVAIQGHALGLFLGVLVGVAVVYRRGPEERPSTALVWLAALALAADKGLWAVYTFLGNNRFVLFRALGVALLFLVAALVAAGVGATARTFVARIDLTYRETAVGLLLAVVVALAAVAVPFNLLVVADPGAGVTADNSVEVRGYTVFYAEDVPNQLVAAADIPFREAAAFNVSGVVVSNADRNIWWTAVGKRELAFAGERSVVVGGVGWRQAVVANRTGWSAVGGPATYRVRLRRPGGEWTTAFVTDPATADPVLSGRNVSVAARPEGFSVVVSRANETLGRAPIPTTNTSVSAGNLTFVRANRSLVAVTDGNATRVTVATRETYR